MNKRLLSLILGLVMVLGAFTSVFAAEETKKEEKVEKIVGKDNKIQYIIDKKFVEGYGNGDYGYDKNIKRSEITKLLVFANGNKELSEKLQGSMKLYKDVETSHWANGVITVGSTVPSKANKLPMLNGYPTGDFKPEADVTYAELAKMLVVLVKEDLTADMVKTANANWASQWMTWAAQLGILDDVTVANSNAPANRADAFTMVYNAMYKMVNFKRVPADAKLGVLSSLRKDKLVLNQDAKEQEYTITDETVFIRTYNESKVANQIRVREITNPDYYLGSLVRIMVNDKKEVSHIIELGNPVNGALNVERWSGVAGKTVQTGAMIDRAKLKDINQNLLSDYALINFNGSRTSAEDITFVNNNVVTASLRINDDTRVFVANPGNNIMREVKDINEALSLIGYQNYTNYRIANVYAGYDTASTKSGYRPVDARAIGNVAKVIVFNSVNKEDKGTMYRVLESVSTMHKSSLEMANGDLVDFDTLRNTNYFPYTNIKKFDVIRVRYGAYADGDKIETLIKGQSKGSFPVVEIVDLDKSAKVMVVKDEDNMTTKFSYADADIFSAKRFDKLEVGSKIQFAVDGDRVNGLYSSLNLEVISILDRNTKLEGLLRDNFVKDLSLQNNRFVGKIVSLQGDRLTVDVIRHPLSSDSHVRDITLEVNNAQAKALKAFMAEGKRDITFLVRVGKYDGAIYDIRENATNHPIIEEMMTKVEEIRRLIDLADRKYNPNKVDADNVLQAKADVAKIDNLISKLLLSERAEFEKTEKPFGVALEAVRAQLDAAQGLKDTADANKIKLEIAGLKQVAEIEKIKEQADVDKAAKALNTVVEKFNASNDEVKAKLVAEKTTLQEMYDAIVAVDKVVLEDTAVILVPLVK